MNITFTGDTSITGIFANHIKNDIEIFSPKILSNLNLSDWVVTNLEGPTTDLSLINDSSTRIKSPKKSIKFLKKRNIKVFNLANNHILDCKTKGLNDTISQIEEQDCLYFGASTNSEHLKPIILEKDNIKVGLFSFSDTTNQIKKEHGKVASIKDIKKIKKNIQNLCHKVDYIIVNFHGGEEFTQYPSPTKIKFLKKIAKLKEVDIIIGHHSHTLQAYEHYHNTHIFYSLGNFIFDIQNHRLYEHTNNSAFITFHFNKQNISLKWTPYIIENGYLKDQNKQDFNKNIKHLSSLNIHNWRKEAHRILFRKNSIREKQTGIESNSSLQNKSIAGILISLNFYKKIIFILLNNNYRDIYVSGVLQHIKRKFTSKKKHDEQK